MTKVITLVRSSGMAPDEFREYWRESVLPSLLAVPEARENLVRVVHNHVLPADARSEEKSPFDQWAGVTEFWYYDRPSAERFLASSEAQQAIASHGKIPEIVYLHVFEIAGWDRKSRETAMKMMGFFIPKDGLSRIEAQRHWSDEHLRVTARLGMSQKLCKYIQNHTFPEYRTSDPRYNFAGGPEMWFETMEEANSIFADEALLAELKVDEETFTDTRQSVMLMLEEADVYLAG